MKKLLEKIIKWLEAFLNKLEGKEGTKEIQSVETPQKVSSPTPQPVKAPNKTSSNPEDPITDFNKPEVFAMLWKPKRDHGPQTVIVAWSDNISYKDLRCEVVSQTGKTIADVGVEAWYERKHNKYGKFGGINFIPGRSAKQWPQNPVKVRFYINGPSGRVDVPVDGNSEIVIHKPRLASDRGRVEVNYKSNQNYK